MRTWIFSVGQSGLRGMKHLCCHPAREESEHEETEGNLSFIGSTKKIPARLTDRIHICLLVLGLTSFYLGLFIFQFLAIDDTRIAAYLRFSIISVTVVTTSWFERKMTILSFCLLILIIYFAIVTADVIEGIDIGVFRLSSLTDLFVAFCFAQVAGKLKWITNKSFNKFISLSFCCLLFFSIFFYFMYPNEIPVIRMHQVWLFILGAEILGLQLNKFNIYLLMLLTFLGFLTYESRIILVIAAMYFVFHDHKGVLMRLALAILGGLALINNIVDSRIAQMAFESQGRVFIYSCFGEKLGAIRILGSSYDVLTPCNVHGYLHSSYLEFIQRYGIGFFVISSSSFFVLLIRHLLFGERRVFLIYIMVFIYSLVEGGLEWFLFFVVLEMFFKIQKNR